MTFRIGIDIGGTFTDFTVVEDSGGVTLWKEDSTADDPVQAIERGLSAVADILHCDLAEFLQATDLFVHGSTIATNAVIQRSGPKIGLLCTEGFRDIIHLRDGFKPERFNIHLSHPVEFVDRYLRLGVRERVNHAGAVTQALSEDDVRVAAGHFRDEGVAAVAVAFLWSIVNPSHEQRAAEILAEELPGTKVILSSQVLPEIREWERTSASVLSAYILPGIDSYLRKLEALLDGAGFPRAPLIMQINGGCASVEEILRRPVFALASGPAAAPAAAIHYARNLDANNMISVDMGGTSFDVCLIRDGRVGMSRTIQIEQQPIGVAGVEVHSVGAGGGSIAWIDSGRALRVGPRSAGAKPGPACYGQGGSEPTVTDANVVLGYLEPEAFLGGRRALRRDLAERAVMEHVAQPLGLDLARAAAGIIEVVDAGMVDAIRAVSVERGIDPRGFMLVAGGGAGALHAARLARKLGMRQLLVPGEAGTYCAFGMTVTDVRHDHSEPLHALTSNVDPAVVNALFDRLETRARKQLLDDGFSADQIHIERAVDARYPNQVHELTLPIESVPPYDRAALRGIEQTFHREHDQRFTYALTELPIECLHWRITAIGRMPLAARDDSTSAIDDADQGTAVPAGNRETYVAGEGMVSFAIHRAGDLVPSAVIDGPAIVQAPTTTVLLMRGDRLQVQTDRSYLIDIGVNQA
jgi:N-methylhydantoinase A